MYGKIIPNSPLQCLSEVFQYKYLKKSVDVIYFDFHGLLIKVYIQGLHWSGNMIGVSKEEL